MPIASRLFPVRVTTDIPTQPPAPPFHSKMQRHTLQRLFTITTPSSSIRQHARAFASKRRPADYSDEDLAAARKWLADLNPDTIPRSLSEITFSRSSGPGGQNVNK
jgi:peptidyl-tRNA hydrolase ICT1